MFPKEGTALEFSIWTETIFWDLAKLDITELFIHLFCWASGLCVEKLSSC